MILTHRFVASSLLVLLLLPTALITHAASQTAPRLVAVTPMQDAELTGEVVFQAELSKRVRSPRVYWQGDGGAEHRMSQVDRWHFENTVDLSLWTEGTHTLSFILRDRRNRFVSKTDITFRVRNASTETNPFEDVTFYVNPNSDAWQTVSDWSTTRPEDAARMELIATQPTAKWFGEWNSDVQSSVTKYVEKVTAAGNLPVMVAYNFPDRHCDGSSSLTREEYLAWIQEFANGIGTYEAVVILEPDALPHRCFTNERALLIKQAVEILKVGAGTSVYLDAGHSNWVSADEMATRLTQAGIEQADGFSLNVSNFYTTEENVAYGNTVSALVGGKHFVIDTGRNGNGSNGEWCNPSGRHIGVNPTTESGYDLVDALLWIKPPGQSDGECNGGPPAGDWWPEYALGLVS